MPQLDKYIFFHQITYLTFFFTLIYMYMRRTIVPKVSMILKYRKKRFQLFDQQLEGYTKIINYTKITFDKKGKFFLSFLMKFLLKINPYYFDKMFNQRSENFQKSYFYSLNFLKQSNLLLTVCLNDK